VWEASTAEEWLNQIMTFPFWNPRKMLHKKLGLIKKEDQSQQQTRLKVNKS
jgi:hypothetical protein